MKKLTMYCLCLHDNFFDNLRAIKYKPVGLGSNQFLGNYLRDDIGKNISFKNKYYGEYTFHYWFWKNMLNKLKNNSWIGFCAYRRFWANNKNLTSDEISKEINFDCDTFKLKTNKFENNKINELEEKIIFLEKKIVEILKKI